MVHYLRGQKFWSNRALENLEYGSFCNDFHANFLWYTIRIGLICKREIHRSVSWSSGSPQPYRTHTELTVSIRDSSRRRCSEERVAKELIFPTLRTSLTPKRPLHHLYYWINHIRSQAVWLCMHSLEKFSGYWGQWIALVCVFSCQKLCICGRIANTQAPPAYKNPRGNTWARTWNNQTNT
jgi:hypothetical protein